MATQSSMLACLENLWIEEHDGLQSIGSQRVIHDWSDLVHTHMLRSQGSSFNPPP